MSTSATASVPDACTPAAVVRFHLALNVTDLARSQAFYRVLLGCQPAKLREDYCKFEPTEPPLVLSLIPAAHAGGGALNHVGMRLASAEQLVAVQARLEAAGYRTQREEGVECCYSRQTKFWVVDPDRTLWELYLLHGDALDSANTADAYRADEGQRHDGPAAGACCAGLPAAAMAELVVLAESIATSQPATSTGLAGDDRVSAHAGIGSESARSAAAPVVWLHNLLEPLPRRLEQADQSVDEVQLQGTFNVPHDPASLMGFLAETRRVLRPLGRLLVHGLVADRPLVTAPELPGPAALVSHVPVESWPAEILAAAGFVSIELTKLAAAPCFTVDGVELRECKLVARQPATANASARAAVIYRGPFRTATDDQGQTYARGQRVEISAATAADLKAGPLAGQFTFLGERQARGGCGD